MESEIFSLMSDRPMEKWVFRINKLKAIKWERKEYHYKTDLGPLFLLVLIIYDNIS